ncbi:related to quinone reductase [Phialocephala subalpina]|uniref:Related to quinone reductase n=1 Tax=Phialocephala subalpina TaxID=576137 RepID=A0A1L7WTF5_9HELO|nr:related to quinone reductase [Phialocephala subalpina]
MKAILIDKFVQKYDDIQISEVSQPRAREGEVLVKIEAAGVNFVDLLYARGKHQNNRSLVKPPFILGLEFSGTVLLSPATSRFHPGDRVFGGAQGTYASHISIPSSSLHHIPSSWDFVSAAGLAATAPVSYGALILRAKLQPGETVLVHAAAGALGLMAVQIAKAVGCRVIGTAGSREKMEVARRFGADNVVDYVKNEDGWWEKVLEITRGEGVDVVLDSVGLVDKSLKCLKQKGRILITGFAGTEGNIEKIAMNRVLLRQAQVIGYRYGMTDRINPAETAKIWEGIKDMWEKGLLRSTVYGKEYRGLESVVEAMKDLAERKVWGKAVIRLDGKVQERPRL